MHGERSPCEWRRAVKPEHGSDAEEPETKTQRPHEMDAVDEAQIPLAGFRAAARNGSGGIGSLGRLYGGIGHRRSIESVRVAEDSGDAGVSALHANGLRPPVTANGIEGPLVITMATTTGACAISLPVASAGKYATKALAAGFTSHVPKPVEPKRTGGRDFRRNPVSEIATSRRDSAAREAQCAVGAWLEAAKAAGRDIPEPSVTAPLDRYSGKFVVRVPRSVHARLARKAKQEGVSLNQLVSSVLSRA